MTEYNTSHPKRKGYYFGDGNVVFKEPYPSVTEILKVFNKEALMFWYAKQAVLVTLDNPSKSVKDIMAETALVSRSGATRGTGIHNIFPKILRGEEYEPYPDNYKPYIDGILKFIEDMKPKIVMADAIVYSDTYKYAGSLDVVLEINCKNVLVDLKTGNTYPEHRLQLASYKQALEETYGLKVDNTAVLLLKGDSVYQYILTNEPFENFLIAKRAWEWWKGINNE